MKISDLISETNIINFPVKGKGKPKQFTTVYRNLYVLFNPKTMEVYCTDTDYNAISTEMKKLKLQRKEVKLEVI